MKSTIFMRLILATLVLFSPTDVSAKLVPVEDFTPQTSGQLPDWVTIQQNAEEDDLESSVKDANKELYKTMFKNANSLFNPSVTVTDGSKRLEELQRLKAEAEAELKHLERLRGLKVEIIEELTRLEELQRLKIKMTEDGRTDRDPQSFTPVGSWETVSIDGKPLTEDLLKAPILPFMAALIKPVLEKMLVPIGPDEDKSVLEKRLAEKMLVTIGPDEDKFVAEDLAEIAIKIFQNDIAFFTNGSWYRTLGFNIEADIGGGVALIPRVSFTETGSYFTPREGTIVMVQEDLQIRLEPEDLWTSANITEEDFKKEIPQNWLFGTVEGIPGNWEASPNGNTLTLASTNGITQVLRRKGSGSKNTWVSIEEQGEVSLSFRWDVGFDGIYKREGFVRTGTDYALLFATDTYAHWEDLSTPIADVEAIGAELENRYGFNVDIRKNVTIKDILATLAEYKEKRYVPGDQLLVYFAGHGKFDEALQDGHIAGTASELPNKDQNLTTYLSFNKLRDDLDNFPCDRIMLMLDVCYGGTFDDNIALIEELPTRGARPKKLSLELNQTLTVRTRWYLSSGGNEVVLDGVGGHSPFAASLLTVLRDGAGDDGVLTLPEIERLLPTKLREELDKFAAAWKEKYPSWDGKLTQSPASGPFGNGKAADKAFVFISKDVMPLVR